MGFGKREDAPRVVGFDFAALDARATPAAPVAPAAPVEPVAEAPSAPGGPPVATLAPPEYVPAP